MRPAQDMTGRRFGQWKVLRRGTPGGAGVNATWVCRCSCGTEREVRGDSLRAGTSTNCGCDSGVGVPRRPPSIKRGLARALEICRGIDADEQRDGLLREPVDCIEAIEAELARVR